MAQLRKVAVDKSLAIAGWMATLGRAASCFACNREERLKVDVSFLKHGFLPVDHR